MNTIEPLTAAASPNVTPDSKNLIRRLQIFQAAETWCARLLGGWLPGIANWEAKHAAGGQLWQNLQTARDLRGRLWELRVSKPDRFEQSDVLEKMFRRLASAQHDFEFIAGLHLGLKRALVQAYRDYQRQTHATWDAPSLPVVRAACVHAEAQIEWAEIFLKTEAASPEQQRLVTRWQNFAEELIAASGLFGATTAPLPELPPAYQCLLPIPAARRDARFKTQLQGFERPALTDTAAHTQWQFLNYTMEMQAAETLGSVLWEVDGMEWEFYFDAGRHCYDECRHCKMGEERLQELGHQLHDFPQFVGNYAWRQLYDPMRRYGMLTYIIEQDSFALKHETYKNYVRLGDARSAEALLYDIIDETLHVRWGAKWLPELLKQRGEEKTLEAVVAECRKAVMENSLSPAQRAYGKK
jgi:uncharacterized ferritin-like protein (DUF455 family)